MTQPSNTKEIGASETGERDNQFVYSLIKHDIHKTRELLERGVTIETVNMCLSQAAAEREFLPRFCLLLEYGDPKHNHNHPLSVAAYRGNLEFVKILAPLSDLQDPECKALKFAAQSGHLDVLQFLEPLMMATHKREAMITAAQVGQLDALRCLFPFASDETKGECFIESVWHGQAHLVEFFLDDGFALDPNNKTRLQKTWLAAVQEGFLKVVQLTSHLVDPLDNNSEALATASMERHRDVFDFLYPLSDPQSALDKLNSMNFFQPEYTELLLRRMKIEKSKKDLQKALLINERDQKTHSRKI